MGDNAVHRISRGGVERDNELRHDLRVVYQATQDARLDSRGRIWDTLKTSATLVAGVLLVAAAAYVRPETDPKFLRLFGYVLLALGLGIGVWNYLNARAEQRHQLAHEFTLFQIESLLGLHREIEQADRWPASKSEYLYMFKPTHLGGKAISGATASQADHVTRFFKRLFKATHLGREEVIDLFARHAADAPQKYAEKRSGEAGRAGALPGT